jgi:hypothetical protein
MIGLFSLLTGPAAKWIGILGITAAVTVGMHYVISQHDARVRAELIASEQAKTIETIKREQQATVSALEQAQATLAARITAQSTTRKAISNAPTTKGCAASPAVAAAIAGLRHK